MSEQFHLSHINIIYYITNIEKHASYGIFNCIHA